MSTRSIVITETEVSSPPVYTRISSDEGGLVTDIIKSFEKHGYKVAVFRCSGSGTPRNSDVMLSPVGLRRTKSGVISSGFFKEEDMPQSTSPVSERGCVL